MSHKRNAAVCHIVCCHMLFQLPDFALKSTPAPCPLGCILPLPQSHSIGGPHNKAPCGCFELWTPQRLLALPLSPEPFLGWLCLPTPTLHQLTLQLFPFPPSPAYPPPQIGLQPLSSPTWEPGSPLHSLICSETRFHGAGTQTVPASTDCSTLSGPRPALGWTRCGWRSSRGVRMLPAVAQHGWQHPRPSTACCCTTGGAVPTVSRLQLRGLWS